MTAIADAARALLVPALLALAAAIAIVLAIVVVQRGVRASGERRRARFRARYQPLLDRALGVEGEVPATVVEALRAIGGWRREELAAMLVEPLRVVHGAAVDRARRVATELGLLDDWRRALDRGRWPARARAALALGAVGDAEAVPRLIRMLDDRNDELRAVAVDALGAIGDVAAVEALLLRIGGPARHQQARLVESLRRIGPAVTASIVSLGADDAARRVVMADLLALVGGAGARVTLLEWTGDASAAVRATAWRAIGRIGLDERAAYHALRALGDADARVRAQAAQALGRTGRADVVPYLEARLDDEWEVAAQGARALAWLGEPGLAALRRRAGAATGGHGLELARHFLWERGRA